MCRSLVKPLSNWERAFDEVLPHPLHVIQTYANFVGLYLAILQILPFYKFEDALSSCTNKFCPCLGQNLVYNVNCPL